MNRILVALVVCGAVACGTPSSTDGGLSPPDASSPDASTPDASTPDASTPDAGCGADVTADAGLVITTSGAVQGLAQGDVWAYLGVP